MNKSFYLSYCVGFLGYVYTQNLIICNVLSHLGIMGWGVIYERMITNSTQAC